MTNITATGISNIDVENLFSGILTATSFTPTQFVLTSGPATLTVSGTGFTYNGTTGLTGGTVTSVDETYTNGNHQRWDGISIPATSLINALQTDLNAFNNLFFGGDDTITFKPSAASNTGEAIVGFGGNDTINYDADAINGGAPGIVFAIDGGAGNDTLNLDAGFAGDFDTLLNQGADNFNVTNVETVHLAAGHDYTLVATDSFATSGTTVTVDGSALGAANKFNFLGTEVQGNLILKGGAGDDLLEGGPGNDIFDGGSGSDTVSLQIIPPNRAISNLSGVTVDLSLTAPQVTGVNRGSDTFISIENLIGTRYDDHLTGNAADNILDGGAGGLDVLDGGAGNDTASFMHLPAGQGVSVSVAVTGMQSVGVQLISIENLIGTNSDDSLTGDSGNNVLTGNAGNDILRGSGGTNTLDGGAGTDTAAYSLAPSNYYVTSTATGYLVRGPGETDTLTNVEQASFDATGQTLSMSQFMAQEFNPLAYIASYGDLIRAFGNNQTAALNHYLTQGYYENRVTSFNALDYVASYGDLIHAFGNNQTAALNHYVTQGYYENRVSSFNALSYIATYGDLIQAFGTNQNAALNHYVTQGYYENRVASFNGLAYIASYSDLIQTYGTDAAGATAQYITQGYYQGRSISFSALAYTASYADLVRAFGNNQTAALTHYITQGIHENRVVSFNALNYIASYGDLINAFGINQAAALNHYVTQGFYENRVVSFDPVAYLLTYTDLQNAGYNAQTAASHYIQFGSKEARTTNGAFGSDQTSHALTLGTQAIDSLTSGDKDWFSINLTAGQSYDLTLSGATSGGMADPFLELHNANGVLVTQDNDSGPGADALIHYTATATGTFYLVAESNQPGGAGNYKILAASA